MQEHASQGLTPGSPSFGDFRSASPPQSRWKDLNPPLPHPPATVIAEDWDKGKTTPFKMQTGWAVRGGRSQGLRPRGQRRKGQCLGPGGACLQRRESWETAHAVLKLGFGTEKGPKFLRFTYPLGTSLLFLLKPHHSFQRQSHCLPSLGKVPGKLVALSSQAFEMTGSQDI